MATPQQPASTAPRRSGRRQRHIQATEETNMTSSETDVMRPQQGSNGLMSPSKEIQPKGRRKSNVKKTQDVPKANPHQNQQLDHHGLKQTEKTKATPIKQAYAGPTFHQSPAPSALPMPSFYSRSVPNVSTTKPPDMANDSGAEFGQESEAEAPAPVDYERRQRESTPLDFLFEAARKAQGTPRAESPSARSNNLSTYGGSPYNRSPAPREGDAVFPFELDENGSNSDLVGAPFATPYKERLESLRPNRSPSHTPALHETERKAKTDALKKLLMNSQPMRSASASPHLPDPNNPFNARAPQPRNLYSSQSHHGHRSGPSTPNAGYDGQQPVGPPQYFPNMNSFSGNHHSHNQSHALPLQRPPSSQLRNLYHPNIDGAPVELSSDNDRPPELISTARRHNLRQRTPKQNANGHPLPDSIQRRSPRHQQTPSTQQLEDDLRRVLKLDVGSKG